MADLLGNTEADGANGVLKNTKIAGSLKYLSNFRRSPEMLLINCKIELKLKWTNHCVLSANGNENDDANTNNIFTIKDAKLYVPVVTLSAKNNQKLSKLLSKGFERSVYWDEHKAKSENKYTTNEYRYCLESKFVEVNRMLVLVYSDVDDNAKGKKLENVIYQKVLLGIMSTDIKLSKILLSKIN